MASAPQTLDGRDDSDEAPTTMSEPLPLAGTIITEHIGAKSGSVTRRAIAIAGRIAADLGATVVRHHFECREAVTDAGLGVASDVFLTQGKCEGSDESSPDAVLTDAPAELDARLAACPIRVVVAHGAPAHLGLADADVTDTAVLALSGILDLIGRPDHAPVPLGGNQASSVAGLAAFSGLMAALAAGRPETVRVSAVEACLWSNWKSYAERLYLGRTPTRQGELAEWQALPCTDGFASFVYLEKDWPAVCRLIGDERLSRPPLDTQAGRRADMAAVLDIVRPWYAARSRPEIYRLAQRQGLPISPVLTVRELLDEPQYAAQRFFAPLASRKEQSPARVPTIPTVWNGQRFVPRLAPPRAATDRVATPRREGRALSGTRVIDLGIITAGASTSALLADLGADVVKVKSPSYIDPFRLWDRGLGAADWWNRSRFFDFTNRNKRGLAVDLKTNEGRELFLDLVASADVVVENFRRGVLERLGLGWDILVARNPRLILCSVTSQGEMGPDAGAASYGSTLEANSGLADLTRDQDDRPLISGILLNYPDQIVSIYAAGIVTLAVMAQRRTAKGARLDISQRELSSFLIGEHILAASEGRLGPNQERPSFTKNDAGRWSLQTAGGMSLPVHDAVDLLEAVASRDVQHAFARSPDGHQVKGFPFALDGAPFQISRAAPWLGQHNEAVLAERLGLDTTRLARLFEQGIIGTKPSGT